VSDRYILIGQAAVPCEDLFEWGEWLETADRVVFQTDVGEYFVSTVFLGLDMGFHFLRADAPKALFETMIFLQAGRKLLAGEDFDAYRARCRVLEAAADQELLDYQRRYPDWIAAERGHEEVVRMVEARTGAKRTPAAALVAD
jgi:hypothetical protein